MNSGEVQFGYISILLSLLIGIFCLRKIRSYDVHEKEPLLTLGLVVVYGGLASILITSIGYRFIGLFTKVDYSQWYWYVLIVGPLEEGAKLLGFLATLRIVRRNIGDPLDGLVYMSAVALGFSLIENFTYANTGNSTEHLLFVRVALSTPAHILSSLPIGLAGYFAFRGKINSLWMLPALLAASFIHGLYDIFCTVNGLMVLIYLAGLWVLALSVLRYLNIRSPYRRSLREFIADSGHLAHGDMVCMVCEDDSPKLMYQEGELRFQNCQACGHFLVTRENAFRIFHRFAPEFKNLEERYGLSESKDGLYALYDCIHIDDEKRVGYFDLEEVDSKLVEIAARIRKESEQKIFLRRLSSILDSAPPAARPLRGARRLAMEVALLVLGLAVVGVAGIFHLRKMELPVLNPDALEDWEGKHLKVSVPKNWKFEYRKESGDSLEVVSFMPNIKWVWFSFTNVGPCFLGKSP